MARIRVLVCDDEDDWKETAEAELEPFGDAVTVDYFEDPEEADKAIRLNHYDVCFIDVYFPVGTKKLQDPRGIQLSKTIARIAPSSLQVLMTKLGDQGFSVIFDHVFELPEPRPVVVNKTAQRREYFYEYVSQCFEKQINRTWKIPDTAEIAQGLIRRLTEREGFIRSDRELSLEVERLLFDLFDEAASIALVATAVGLRIEELHLGQSGSVVAQLRIDYGLDQSGKSILGTRCVVKFGSRRSIAEEEKRYRAFVRMGLPSSFRVELLQTAYGDSLGAICYSFAGGDADVIQSLDEVLIEDQNELEIETADPKTSRALEIITALFDSRSRSWDDLVGRERVIADFYVKEFNADFEESVRLMSKFVERERIGHFRPDDGVWTLNGFKLRIPINPDLGSGIWKKRSPSCLVHGDLHGGNVLVNEKGVVNMIDFATVSVGPRFADTAALAATIRLQLNAEIEPSDISKIFKAESLLAAEAPSQISMERSGNNEQWFLLSHSLNELALKNAVRRHEAQAIRKELLMTQLCYALSIFKLPWHSRSARLRLVIWSAALLAAINGEKA